MRLGRDLEANVLHYNTVEDQTQVLTSRAAVYITTVLHDWSTYFKLIYCERLFEILLLACVKSSH